MLEEHLRRVGPGGARTPDLRARTPFGPDALQRLLADLTARQRVLLVDREWYVHVDAAERLREQALAALTAFHAREPLKAGMSKEELRTRLGGLDERVFLAPPRPVRRRRRAHGRAGQGAHRRPPGPPRARSSRRCSTGWRREFRQAGVAPPSAEEAFGKLGVTRADDQALLQLLLDERRLVRIKEGLYFHAEPLREAEARVAAFLRERKEITPQDMKDLLGISRKYAIPLLEYLDAQRLTVRVGDKRVLREAAR